MWMCVCVSVCVPRTWSQATLCTSKWLVGSSSSRMSAFWSMARTRASFIFQPPDSAATPLAISSSLKPTSRSCLTICDHATAQHHKRIVRHMAKHPARARWTKLYAHTMLHEPSRDHACNASTVNRLPVCYNIVCMHRMLWSQLTSSLGMPLKMGSWKMNSAGVSSATDPSMSCSTYTVLSSVGGGKPST